MRALLFLLLATPLLSWGAQAADCLKIGVASGATSTTAVERIADRVFAIAGSCAEIVVLPNNRLSAMTDTGEIDGEAFKGQGYLEQHSALMKVPTPVYSYTGNLYWPKDSPEPSGPSATVGVLLGQLWPKAAARERNLAIFEVRSYDQMIEMSRTGRLQGFLMAGEALATLRPRFGYLNEYDSRAVAEIPLHLVLNKRHAALIPALDRAIQTLLARGDIDRERYAEDR